VALLCWITLPVIVFLGDYQVLQHSVINAGFIAMTIVHIRSTVLASHREQKELVVSQKRLWESKQSLLKLNAELNEKIQERTKALEYSHEKRNSIFIKLAHEIKTPLTLINNFLDLQKQNHGNTAELTKLSEYISQLNDHIIDFFRLEEVNYGAGQYDHSSLINLSEIITNNSSQYKTIAGKKSITIDGFLETDIHVRGNSIAIERILANTIEYAIHFTQENDSIKITLLSEEELAVIKVHFDGWIPSHLRDKIFEPYFKIPDLPNSVINNDGPGLLLVKNLVEEIGGSFTIDEQNAQIEFIIKLPKIISDIDLFNYIPSVKNLNPLIKGKQTADIITSPDLPNILVVEDNLEMLSYLANLLQGKYNVYTATGGIEALKKLSEKIEQLDLILSDVMMDEMDGFTFCKKISESEKFSHVPFIFITAKTTHSEKLEGIKLGAIDYLEKPFQDKHLLSKIESILNLSKKLREAVIKNTFITLQTEQVASTQLSLEVFERNCQKHKLTPRQIEVIALLIKGLTFKEIGDKLCVAYKTIDTHVTNINKKLGVSTRAELVKKLQSEE
jgi:DNA-binding NarL/FixJ family response regulator/signal transduction histidine kinase